MSPRAFLAPRNPNHPNQPLIGKQLPEQSPVGLTQSPTHCESHHIDPLAAMSSPVDGGEKQQHQETSDCRARDSRSPSPAVLASSPVVEVAEAPLARAAPVVPKLAAAATCDNCEAATVLLRGRCRDVRSRPHTDGKGDARPPLNLLRLQTSSRPGDEAVLRAGAPRHQTAQQTHTAATKLRGGTHFTRVQSNLTPKAEAASGGERSTTAAAVAEAQPRRTSSSASNTKSAALPSRRLMRTLSTKTNASNLTRTSSAFSGFPAPTANPKTPAHRARSRSRRGCGDASRPAEADKERPTALKKNCHRSSHRFSTLHERYENAQVSLALLRGLVLRADTSLLSLLAKYQASTVTRSDFSAIGKAETSLPFALATVRRLIVRVNPAGFSGKVEEGCLWTLGPHDLSQLEEAAIPGVVSALREVVVAHDWCRATCWYLYCSNEGKESAVPFSRTGSGYLMRRASSARDADTTSNRASGLGVSALEAACMELYANMHVLLTLAQSANAVKRVR